MFFTSPRILKFEFDNSYSWITSKTIKYKINIFYPKNPYLISHQILLSKYQKDILRTKNLAKKKTKKKIKDISEKLLLAKIDEDNKVFNCVNVKQNLDAINKMIKDKYLSISSIFIKLKKEKRDKSYFYYYKENEGLIENELTKELFEKYICDLLTKSNENLNIVNLYIINGDSSTNHHHYYYYQIKKLLGFEPEIKMEGVLSKIIFFIQYLNQAQLLYYLYRQIINGQSAEITILVNYTKFGGYQIILYNSEEIILNLNEFNGLDKNASIDENIQIITKVAKNIFKEDRKMDIVLPISIDDKENVVTPEQLEEKLGQALWENENDKNNIRIIKTDLEFNKELEINSHVFYLDN